MICRRHARSRNEGGSVGPFVAVLAAGILVVTGLVLDGGQVIATQARARDLAANAARAGAQEIDIAALRATGRPALDRGRATTAARSYLAQAGATGEVAVTGQQVTVTVRLVQPMRILPVPDRAITDTETATAVSGLRTPDQQP